MYPKTHTHGAYDPTYCNDVFSDKYNEILIILIDEMR